MDSYVGLGIQCVGIGLVTLLSFFMLRSIHGASQKYWTIAWSCLSLSLSGLIIAFHVPALRNLCYAIYFFGEYAFAFMFMAGCRYRAAGKTLTGQQSLLALGMAVCVAASLPHLSDDFNDLFLVQSSIMAVLFGAAFFALRPARLNGQSSLGLRVMSAALFLLTLDFLHYVPVFGSRHGAWGIGVPEQYLQYTSIIDLTLETLLAFGSVIVVMEDVRREVEATNRELMAARDRLELIARVDPLTEALNRHAFHTLLKKGQDIIGDGVDVAATDHASGCVAVVDLDNLKLINDSHGHAAGDKAIRAVAHAIRSIIRADDLLFRWGGDEFLVLLFGLPPAEARRRLDTLNTRLADTTLTTNTPPAPVLVSHGLARFETMTSLQQAIEEADETMYKHKQTRKAEQLERAELNAR